jgi:hypothetical protein
MPCLNLFIGRHLLLPLLVVTAQDEVRLQVSATSLSGDPAVGFSEDASAGLREHPALLWLLNLAPGLVLAAVWIRIWPSTVMSSCPEIGNPITNVTAYRAMPLLICYVWQLGPDPIADVARE